MAAAEWICSNLNHDFQTTLTYSALLYDNLTSDLRIMSNMSFCSHGISDIPNQTPISN